MHHAESISTFHKYFPSLSLDKDEDAPFPSESPRVLFQQSFSNHLAAKILQPDDELPSSACLSLTQVAKVRAFRGFLSNLNKTKASGVGKGGPKHSWSDMPKFLLAGAVSTVLSRSAFLPSSLYILHVSAFIFIQYIYSEHVSRRWRESS